MADNSTKTLRISIPIVDEEESDGSPEPSPPPPPPFYDPWTPAVQRTATPSHQEDISLPSLPEAPSPYSPPSSSLFSGQEEWPPKSARRRKPLKEVNVSEVPTYTAARTPYSADFTATTSRTPYHHTPALSFGSTHYPQTEATPAFSLNELPSVQRMKSHLQGKNRSLYLLQQENRSLAAECDRFQEQLTKSEKQTSKEKEAILQRYAAKKEQLEQLQSDKLQLEESVKVLQEQFQNQHISFEKRLAIATKENERLQEKLAKLESQEGDTIDTLETMKSSLDRVEAELLSAKCRADALDAETKEKAEEITKLQEQISQLRLDHKSSFKEHVAKLQQERDAFAEKERVLGDQHRSKELELDRFKAMLKDAEMRYTKLENETRSLTKHLEDEKDALLSTLEQERQASTAKEGAIMEQSRSKELEMDRLKAMLKEAEMRCAKVENDMVARTKLLGEEKEGLVGALERERKELAAKEGLFMEQNRSKVLEIDRLKAMHKDAELRCTKFETNANLLGKEKESYLVTIKELTDKASTLQRAMDDVTANGILLTEQNASKEIELVRLQSKLIEAERRCTQTENEAATKVKQLEEENSHLKVALGEMTAKASNLEEDLHHAAADSRRLERGGAKQLQIDRLQSTLKDMEMRVSHLQSEVESLQGENDGLIATLRKFELSTGYQVAQCKEDDVALKTALEQANEVICELRAEKAAMRKELAEKGRSRTETACQTESNLPLSTSTQTDPWTSKMDPLQPSVETTLTKRIERIRDAAERASLVHEYRKEIARIKSEHDQEIMHIQTKHDESLKEMLKEAKSNMNTRFKEYKRRLQRDHELATLELKRVHALELSQVREDVARSTEKYDAALHAAIQEVSAISKQLDIEKHLRDKLEIVVRQLESQVKEKREAMPYEESLRLKWEQETKSLIASIQKECNEAFDRKSMLPYPAVPKAQRLQSVDKMANETSLDKGMKMFQSQPFLDDLDFSDKLQIAPDLNRTLDETEAFVRSLIGTDFP